MAKIIIEIKQVPNQTGVVCSTDSIYVPVMASIEVDGSSDEIMASLVAHKLAETYHATLEAGIRAAVTSIVKEGEKHAD
ncbi:hypothetical protein [Vibrio parahaemolyticus]|uniref:hypothetical protein n=1 Tax=Vibrio parahaemolyticus TaxID=670 RepID=UPI0023DB7EFB|nr:hypothetical protein [Vibrio parahaemolyticus]EGR3388130.1 hypothetical protein [Vibrio parahaemolyticus]EJZ3961914.1 hypothetical protein [Vibrio parahaemolyticus]MDF2280480.1 hypothetical protein [Vibrio parahaemolyticus]MDF2287522.1 hypothetical protein [Vibrio parahaemolyticus]MDF2289278.1 hypothetical protein [Vibrio parahaemolyticus]